MNRIKSLVLARLLLLLMIGLMTLSGVIPNAEPLSAQSAAGTIAYAHPNERTGDEIWLIGPNGSDQRRIWSAGAAPSPLIESVRSLAWRPDGSELAFISDHEKFHCSIFESDIYAVRADGSSIRRITNAPACAEFSRYPKGAVQIEVENRGRSTARFSVYVQGAKEFQGDYVGAGEIQTLTFTDVADFGADVLQYAVAINNTAVNRRSWGAPVDVKAGSTVKARLVITEDDALLSFGAKHPTWRQDGSKLGFVLGLGTVQQIGHDAAPPALGAPLLSGATTQVLRLAWSPAASTANQILYVGRHEENGGNITGIYRTQEGQGRGERLISVDAGDAVLDLAWLPDGSGFLYAMTENFDDNADIYEYQFASRRSIRLTRLNGEFARRIAISPDGQQIVFERATALWYGSWETPAVDLWIVNRNGSNLRLLVRNGYAPAWGPDPAQNPPTPTPTLTATPMPTATRMPLPTATPVGAGGEIRIYLPLTQR